MHLIKKNLLTDKNTRKMNPLTKSLKPGSRGMSKKSKQMLEPLQAVPKEFSDTAINMSNVAVDLKQQPSALATFQQKPSSMNRSERRAKNDMLSDFFKQKKNMKAN